MKEVKVPTFVKWAGGKKQLLSQFNKFFPTKIERYFDAFVGGGSVAFYILQKYKPKEVFISDINKELIDTYEIIRDDLEKLIKKLREHKKKHDKEYFYKIRKQNPNKLSKINRAGRFIYLNKSCFNGLYRVNAKGGFNVPIGSSKTPAILPEEDLRLISKLLKDVTIKNISFDKILDYTKEGDFIYFDPPYYPLKKESFTTYTKGNFLQQEQEKLRKVFEILDKKKCKVMLSNSDTDFIKDLYKEYAPFKFVKASRMINCIGEKRGKISEIVVLNYEPPQKEI